MTGDTTIDKVRAVEYIATDWKSSGVGPIVAVDYDIEGIWAWVPELTELHSKYYPNVYTIGRALDYEFERMHQLKIIVRVIRYDRVQQPAT